MTLQSQSFDVSAYLSEGWARRQRLMNAGNAFGAQKAIAPPKPVERQPVKLVWGDGKPFQFHVSAYKSSSAFARTPKAYLIRRSLELGFTEKEITGPFIFLPFAMARRMLAWELREKFGLKELKISRLLKRDHSCVYQLFKQHPRPTEEEASMRLVLEPGMTFLRSFERAYKGGMLYSDINATYRITHRSIRILADRMRWPKRGKDSPIEVKRRDHEKGFSA
jgi:hypothetical protein